MFEKLKKKSSKVHIIVEQQDLKHHKIFSHNDIKNALDKMVCSYWFILHDNDTDVDGMQKHNHYHIIMQTHSPKMLETFIVNFAYHLGCERKIISINQCSDLLENIRYLLHLDCEEKFQYEKDDIITNDIGILNEAYIYITSLTTSMLIDIVYNSNSMVEILQTLGLSNFKKYNNIINTIWKEKLSNTQLTYQAVKDAKNAMINNFINTMRLYGLENKCDNFMEQLCHDIVKRLGDY